VPPPRSSAALLTPHPPGSKPEVSLEPLSRLDVHVAGRRLLHPHKGLADPRGITTENISQVRGWTAGMRMCVLGIDMCMHRRALRKVPGVVVRLLPSDTPQTAVSLPDRLLCILLIPAPLKQSLCSARLMRTLLLTHALACLILRCCAYSYPTSSLCRARPMCT
jgi:hypothetical protein